VGLARSSIRYRPRKGPTDQGQIQQILHAFAQNPRKRRRGYRLVHAELQRKLAKEGKRINHKRIYRLWREAGLCIPPRRSKKKVRSGKPVSDLVAHAPDVVWCLDFLEDKTLSGQNLRILCVSDEFSRQILTIEVGTHFICERVVAILQRLTQERARPGALRMDNGPEFIAVALRGFCYRAGIQEAYIDPGKPWQNGYAEGLHSRLRDEFLDGEVFVSVMDARVRLESWRRYFNEERLHSSLGYRTPCEFAAWWEASRHEGDQMPAAKPACSPEAPMPADPQQPAAGTEEAGGT
jgi:transposase InsO family protein